MAQTKAVLGEDGAVAPFATATRTPVRHVSADLSAAETVPSPARMLQSGLERSLDGYAADPVGAKYAPRLVTASVVTVCLACWLALYLAAAAIF